LQRRLVQLSDSAADRLLRSTLGLYAANYLIALPALIFFLHHWAELSLPYVAMGAIIAVGEHIGAEAYRIAVILPRYRRFLVIALARNLLLVAASVILWLLNEHSLSLRAVLILWSSLSGVLLLVLGLLLFRTTAGASGPSFGFIQQIRASRT